MITVTVTSLHVPGPLRIRLMRHRRTYDAHTAVFVRAFVAPVAVSGDLAWIANAPAVAPILQTVPEPYRDAILRACVIAVEQVYRIPAQRRAEAERVGRAGWKTGGATIPRRTNPMASTVNRKVVPAGKEPGWYLHDIARQTIAQISPEAAEWVESVSGTRRGRIYDLCLALTMTLGSPEGFPPNPIDGERYTDDELYRILNLWLEHTGEYNRLDKKMREYRERKTNSGVRWDTMFNFATEYDIIKHGMAEAKRHPTGGPMNSFKQQLDDAMAAVTDDLQRYENKIHAADRLGEDWPEVVAAVVFHRGNHYPAEQSITAAHNIDMLAEPLRSDIIRYAFRHSEVNKFGGYGVSLSTLLKNSMADNAEWQRISDLSEAKRKRDLAVLTPALAPLLNLDRAITLADVAKRLPPGFKAETTRYGTAELTFPSGYRPSESQGSAKWDKLVRNLLSGKW